MDVGLPTIFVIAVIALFAPGPAVLVIIGTALSQGAGRAMGVAAGIVTVSLMWSALAAFGMAAVMFANAWIL
ncbi:MAG: LysE family translocator, partial [Pseudomonadota bacterium]